MVLYEWSIESLGLFDLKRLIIIRRSVCVTSKYRKSCREQTAPYAFESLSRPFDVIHRLVCAAPLQIQRAKWFTQFVKNVYYIYIYIYAFSRRFYPKRLTLHSSYSFTFDHLHFTVLHLTSIKKLNAAVCCSETNSSALSLYFRWQNWANQTTLCLK